MFQEVLRQIAHKQFAPVYLVTGTEQYLIGQFIKQLQKSLAQEFGEIDEISFDMKEVPLTEALAEANSLPFLSERRLILLRNPYFLTGERPNGVPEQTPAKLQEYLENPNPATILVVIADYKKLDQRKKVTKMLQKSAVVVEAVPLKERAIQNYVLDYLNNAGYEITKEAFQLLLQLTNEQFSALMNELDKLMIYAAASRKITKEAVASLVPRSLEHNIFALTELVLQGEKAQALRLYADLLHEGEETLKILAVFLSQIRLYIQVKILQQSGLQQGPAAQMLKTHPYRVKLAWREVRRYPLNELFTIYDRLVELEYQIKTGRVEKELAFQLLILKINTA